MIGIDIIAVHRMERFIERYGDKGLERFLHPSEIVLAKNPKSTAGLWAAKEAVSKALGCGIGKELGFHDITISKDEKGAPLVDLSQKTRKHFGVKDVSLSITHDGDYAVAAVLVTTS